MKTIFSTLLRAECVLLLLIACLIALVFDDRYGFLSYRFGLTAFKTAILLIGVWAVLEISLFVYELVAKPSRKYSVRWIMMCMAAAAIATVTFQYGEKRTAAYEEIIAMESRLSKVNGNSRRIRDDEEFELSMLNYETINGHKELTELNFYLEETDCGC